VSRLELNNKNIQKKLLHITWPLFIETVLFSLLGSMDIFMLGKYSDNAVAAVGVVNQLMNMLNLLFGVISTGTMILCAQYLGAKNGKGKIIQLSGVSIGFNTLIGIILSIIMVVFGTAILRFMNISEELMLYSKQYLHFVGGFIFTQAILSTFTAIIRSHGFTKICMYVTLGMNILNVILNYVLIYGNFGAPSLGVVGSAISTTTSRILGVLILGYFLFKNILNGFSLKYFKTFPFDELKKILGIGLPSAGEQLSYDISQIVITMILTLISIEAMTTKAYISNVVLFANLFSISIAQGTSILVGHLIGEGKEDTCYKLCFSSLKKGLLITAFIAFSFALLGKHIFGLFTTNTEIITLGSTLLIIDAILEPGRVFNLVIISSLKAAGDVKFPVYIGIVSMWFFGVIIGYLLGITMHMGVVGIWIGFTLDEWIRAILVFFRWKNKKWVGKSFTRS
jgi:putative MATE family efflux protein